MAAPLGFKTFTVGEVLSAADVNGYLMQGVLVFASTAARDAAITSPQEGQFAFTKDTNSLFYYDGAAWVASGATGDIEGVTAGTGISGGGTSGTVTVTNSMATAIDAKGDLIVGTGADTFSRLAAGTNTYTLVANSATATGLEWQAPASSGLTLISNTTYSGVSSHSVNNCFSATYRNYKLFISCIGTVAAQTSLRMRASGTDNTASNYSQESDFASGSRTTGTSWQFMRTDNGVGGTAIIDMVEPFVTEKTIFNNQTIGNDTSNVDAQYIAGQLTVTTSYDGFTIFPQSGTISGRVMIYGYAI